METATKERPILFSGPMVRAILSGKKTVTRRVVKPQPPDDRILGECCYSDTGWAEMDDPSTVQPAGCYCNDVSCPYGQPGDRLWVREAWQAWTEFNGIAPRDIPVGSGINYLADGNEWDARKRPPMFMPRWASRITLEVNSVRVERLQEITHEDALAEGCEGYDWVSSSPYISGPHTDSGELPQEEFAALWDQLNADRGYGWHSNPWVWRVEFERIVEANQG